MTTGRVRKLYFAKREHVAAEKQCGQLKSYQPFDYFSNTFD